MVVGSLYSSSIIGTTVNSDINHYLIQFLELGVYEVVIHIIL